MAVWDKTILWGFLLMLAGAVDQYVKYPPPVCAVKGSTVTLPCTFKHPKYNLDGKEVFPKTIRVVWCQNHLICQGSTPSVYDSDSTKNDPRYKYLGDKTGNCTLQITDIQTEDNKTLRFRMEAEDGRSDHTGQSGVRVTVVDDVQLNINGSTGHFREGEAVTLSCTAPCTFHQLQVTWFKDGHALSETGPALRLSSLAAKDSGNYTCGVKMGAARRSLPHRLQVEPAEEGEHSVDKLLVTRVVLFTLHTVLIVIVAAVVIRRGVCRRTAAQTDDRSLHANSDGI